jgi:hypothetical protein
MKSRKGRTDIALALLVAASIVGIVWIQSSS